MTGDSPSKDSNDWQHLTSLRRNLAFGNRVSLQHHQWNYITSENTPVWASFLDNTAALACLPFAMLDTSQIQEIQRIFTRFKGLKRF